MARARAPPILLWPEGTIMETSARFVLIGAFSVLAILAGLGFFLWLAKIELDRNYATYEILFDSVEGLGASSPVRFNGVDVGQVQTINLDRSDPSRVRVRIEVGAGTPVRLGTVATLQSQGVTGVSFVALNGGFPDAPQLQPDPTTGLRLIPSEASVVQGLIEDAPDLLQEAISLMKDLRSFTSDENLQSLTQILNNVEKATGRLDAALTEFSEITGNVSTASKRIASFTGRLDAVATNADAALVTANRTLGTIDEFARTALPQIARTTNEAKRLIESLTRLVERIERDPARFFLGNRTPEYN